MKRGYSPAVIADNIALMRQEGRPQAQAVAIALDEARRSYRTRFPSRAYPVHLAGTQAKRRKNPKMTPRQQVIRFAKENGLKVNTSGGVPMVSTPDGNWYEVFDNWQQAFDFFAKHYRDGSKPWQSRSKNPVPASRKVKLREAIKLYENFTGHEGEVIARMEKPDFPDTLLCVGEIDGILYSTVRDGVLEKYIHEFDAKSRPLFCVTHDGTQIVLLGGAYDFTERGIVDRTGRKR